MRVEQTEDGMRAVDRARRSVEITVDDYVPLGSDCYLHDEKDTGFGTVDRRYHCDTDRVRLPPASVTVIDTTDLSRDRLPRGESVEVGPEHLVVVEAPVLVHLRPSSECLVSLDDDSATVSGLDEISLGFETTGEWTTETLRVEQSVEGLAEALSTLDVGMPDGSPDRTWPNLRDHPPALEFTERGEENVDEFRPDAGSHTSITVPDAPLARRSLVAVATLAHYLGSEVSVGDVTETTLRAAGETFTLGRDPDRVDEQASDWLRRVFILDCYARTGGPYGSDLRGQSRLSDHGLDRHTLYEDDLAERVVKYLSVPEVDDDLPDWHLAVHLHPTLDRCERLPDYLRRLADVVLPHSAELTTSVERSQWADAQRLRGGAVVDQDVYVDPTDRAETVGWDAPNTALGAFNPVATPQLRPEDETPVEVTVAHGSPDMTVDQQYAVGVSLETVTPERLAQMIESDADVLHYVGHHDERGLECRGGYLDMDSVAHSNLRAAFLNGCGTECQARKLVERGAVTAVGTTRDVRDATASEVGRRWSSLVSLGWSIQRALRVSASDLSAYTVFGAGDRTLCQSDAGVPPRTMERDGDLIVDYRAPRQPGWEVSHSLCDDSVLSFETVRCSDEDRCEAFRRRLDSPVF